MSCLYTQCDQPISSVCICSKSSFLCSSHSLMHLSTCKSPQVPLKSLRSEEESERLKKLLNQIRTSVLAANSKIIQSIQEITDKFLNDLIQIENFLQFTDSLVVPQPNLLILNDVVRAVRACLGIQDFLIDEILANDHKDLKNYENSFSTAESFAFSQIFNKNPVGMPLEKEDGIAWLKDNGFEFKSEEICEITMNKEANFAYLC